MVNPRSGGGGGWFSLEARLLTQVLGEGKGQQSGRAGSGEPHGRDDTEYKPCAPWEARGSTSASRGSYTCIYVCSLTVAPTHVCRQLQMLTHSAQEFKGGRICKVRKRPNAPIWCSFLKALYRFLCVDVLGKHRLNRLSGNSRLTLPLCGTVTRTRKMGEATVCIQPQLPQDAKNQKWHLPLALGGPVFSKLWVWLLESSG